MDQEKVQKPAIEIMAYGPDSFEEETVFDTADVNKFIGAYPVTWINIDGPVDADIISQLGKIFSLHPLVQEDILHLHQRAKIEQYTNYLFVVVRMLLKAQSTETEQLSMFLGQNYVLTIQEKSGGDCLAPVREKIRKGWGEIRLESADYLAYAVLDAVIDGYFPMLEELGERLEELEEKILRRSDQRTPRRVHKIKRDILQIRRAIWPLREVVNALYRDPIPFISDKTRLYMRDCHDHALRIMDLVEMYRELGSDLMDVYLTTINNRMNEVMKVLTIIATLFIPPTFIAGIYGMNFNHAVSPWNMPELEWYYGYPFALALMAILVIALAIYLFSRGWLGATGNNKDRI